MRIKHSRFVCVAAAVLAIAGCTGTPVNLGSRTPLPVLATNSRPIEAEACGFQLLLFIPININNRQARAYQILAAQAAGDLITDVQVTERWTYGFVGTSYCTALKAKAVPRTTAS